MPRSRKSERYLCLKNPVMIPGAKVLENLRHNLEATKACAAIVPGLNQRFKHGSMGQYHGPLIVFLAGPMRVHTLYVRSI